MRKVVSISLLILAAAFIAACSDSATSNPVAPVAQSSSLNAVTAEDRVSYNRICHNAESRWFVIEVNPSAALQHIYQHGDYSGHPGPNYCPAVWGVDLGDDCSFCVSS